MRAKQRRGHRTKAAKQTEANSGLSGVQQRQPESAEEPAADDIRGSGACCGWGDGNHTAHTDGHTATLGSLYNVNGGRLYPTLLSFMHLGGKHSSIDSKLWPVIGVGFGVPDFLFFLPLFLYLCFENTKPKNEARIRGANSAPG